LLVVLPSAWLGLFDFCRGFSVFGAAQTYVQHLLLLKSLFNGLRQTSPVAMLRSEIDEYNRKEDIAVKVALFEFDFF
jgi:hypothetical protein